MAPVIGFDFDECLAQAYSFIPMALLFEVLLPRQLNKPGVSLSVKNIIEKSRNVFYDLVAANEVKTKGTLFRPSLLTLMPKLIELRQQGHIDRLFMYSNNGYKDVLNVMDHILALVLQKKPYNVKKDSLINEEGVYHVLTPRVHIDDPCRAVESKSDGGFREKSLEGIQSCLGFSVSDTDLWFLDDTRFHVKLMNSIKDHYVVVKPYTVKLTNKRLSELLIESIPIELFTPGNRSSQMFLSQLQVLLPRFRPSGKETFESLNIKLVKELTRFSPLSGGRPMANWKEGDSAVDLQYLENSLRGAMTANQVEPDVETSMGYSVPIGGSQSRRLLHPRRSRSKINRGFRTRRKRVA